MALAMLGRVAFGLLLAGCSHVAVIEVDDAREGQLDQEAMEAVEEACDILGIECEISVADHNAPLTLVLTQGCDRNHNVCGRAHTQRGCHRAAWAPGDNPRIIAHELGHMLGLEHVDDENNLMFKTAHGQDAVTDSQRAKMERNIARLSACP